MKHLRLHVAIVSLLMLTACGGTVETPGEPLRLLSERPPEAFLEEPYQATLRAVGGLRPFTYTHSAGDLPPGLAVSGGAIVGTPTATGRFTFTITVSDASLNRTFQEYTLSVSEVPPPTITFNVPVTEVQRRVTLRAVVDGRDLRAFRTRATWNGDLFSLVEGSLSHANEFVVFTRHEPGVLDVHVAALGEPASGSRQAFSFDLEPIDGAPTLQVQTATEFLARDRHFYAEATEGSLARPEVRQDSDPNDGVDGTPGDPPEDDGEPEFDDPPEDVDSQGSTS